MNGVCNDMGTKIIHVPIDSLCPPRWFYWSRSQSAWKLDNTLTVRCRGILCNFYTMQKFYLKLIFKIQIKDIFKIIAGY